MKKAIALLGTLFLIVSIVPMGAIADSSAALPQFVFSLMFQSVTTPSFVDVTNYNASTDTTSSSSTVSLANSVGSYSQINRTGIPVAQNLICVKFSINNPSAHFFDDISIEPYINGSPAHLYGTYTQSDYNNQIDYYMFFYIGEDSHRVKDGSGQDITPWGIRITTNAVRTYAWNYSSSTTSFYYYNYTLQSQTIDPGEAADLALNIINVLQLSQLSENLGMINTQLDTGNIASMMESMLLYISNIPDIIQYIDQLENIDNNISNAINIFLDFYSDQFDPLTSVSTSDIYYFDNDMNPLGPDSFSSNNFWVRIPISPSNGLYKYQIYFYLPDKNIQCTGYRYYSATFPSLIDYYQVDTYSYITPANSVGTAWYTVYYISSDFTRDQYLYLHFTADGNKTFYLQNYATLLFTKSYNTSWYQRIELYFKQLLYGSNNNIPSDVQQTTDEINQNAQAVNNFQSSTQQSLDQNLQNVPVADYQIQATTGTQYMKAYSEALFNASNGFRIWFMLPLILFLIGMLIRWGIKK